MKCEPISDNSVVQKENIVVNDVKAKDKLLLDESATNSIQRMSTPVKRSAELSHNVSLVSASFIVCSFIGARILRYFMG